MACYSNRVFGDTVNVEGMITLVDENPNSFYFYMLHELGHLLDSNNTHKFNPYLDNFNCLKRSHSLWASDGSRGKPSQMGQ